MRITRSFFFATALAALSVVAACSSSSSSSSSGGGSGNAGASCKTVSDCTGGTVCVNDGTASVCTVSCSASADSCSASASCQGVGSISVKVCEPKPAASDPAPNPAKKKVPCTTDAECSTLAPGAVCATFQGVKDCSIPCTADSQCNANAGGVTTTFLKCLKDEGNAARTVCLPNLACLTNPLACTSGFPSDDGGGIDDFDAGF